MSRSSRANEGLDPARMVLSVSGLMERTLSIGKQRIEKRLDQFQGLIDMTDWDRRPSEQITPAFLSRALAAYCVQLFTETTAEVAAKSVTDSFHDRGIDAIYYDQKSSRLVVVQSKWADEIAWKECGEFCDGVRKLIQQEWSLFANNAKISCRQKEIASALEGTDTRITLLTVCIGTKGGDPAATGRVDALAAEIDGGAEIANAVHWKQKELLDALKSESEPQKIDADLVLSEYGEVKEPYPAIYGRVQAQAIVDLWKEYPHLSHSNLRRYFNRTDVNSAMEGTVRTEPHHFWYFNNGLTIICDSFQPGVSGRINRKEGIFRFKGMSLVNGAQTTGILADHIEHLAATQRDKLWIQIRAIATKDCPEGFETQITKYTNLQNAVTAQDFVALDSLHSRLAADFAVDHRHYVFKWGEREPDPEDGCTLRDATIALACADPETWLAVQVKREISILWQTEGSRYRKLFHENLNATRVWNAVRIMREVDANIKSLGNGSDPKATAVAAHLQRIILHCVFRSTRLNGWDTQPEASLLLPAAGEACHEVFRKTCEYVKTNHAGDYLASLSKNFEKSGKMIRSLLGGSIEPTLFPEPPQGQPHNRAIN